MDTKRLVRAYTTLPAGMGLGAVVGAVAGSVFALVLFAARGMLPDGPEPLIDLPSVAFLGAYCGGVSGLACGLVGRLIGGPIG